MFWARFGGILVTFLSFFCLLYRVLRFTNYNRARFQPVSNVSATLFSTFLGISLHFGFQEQYTTVLSSLQQDLGDFFKLFLLLSPVFRFTSYNRALFQPVCPGFVNSFGLFPPFWLLPAKMGLFSPWPARFGEVFVTFATQFSACDRPFRGSRPKIVHFHLNAVRRSRFSWVLSPTIRVYHAVVVFLLCFFDLFHKKNPKIVDFFSSKIEKKVSEKVSEIWANPCSPRRFSDTQDF